MGSFTQGGIALGQSLGGGIENYVAGRERRELLVGKALGIAGQLGADDKRTDEDNKLLKKLENVNELGTRQLQSLISEFETGEELQMMDMKRRLASAQTEAAEAKLASMKGLADFTSKGMPATEAGFEGTGDYGGPIPTWAQRERLDKGEAYPVFPGELNPIYEEREISGGGAEPSERALMGAPEENPYLDEIDRRRAEDDAWLNRALAEEREAARNPNLLGIRNLEPKHPWESGGRLEALKRAGASRAKKDLYNTTQNLKEKYKNIKGLDSYLEGELFKEDVLEPYKMPLPDVASAPLEVEQPEAGEPAAEEPAAEAPRRTSRELVGYDVTGGRDTPTSGDFDRMLTGGTPDTPMDERRGQLIDSLAQYGLTPADRKQAIDMISEKYPKLKEFATTIVTADGEEIGSKVGNTFVKKAKGRVATPQGWKVKSRSVNQSTGEETVVFYNPKDEPTYVPTASKYAEADPELTFTNENAPSEGQAKEFNTAIGNAKKIQADAKHLIEMTKDVGWFSQRVTDRKFIADVSTTIGTMRGLLRPILIGPGAMSDLEQKLLEDALPNPADFLRMDSATIQRFESLSGLVDKKMKYHGESIGLWDYAPIGEGGQSGVGGTTDDPLGKFGK